MKGSLSGAAASLVGVGGLPDDLPVLVLTKMNWNSANAAGALPITLRFSQKVGDILREVPDGETPQPSYRFYM